MATEGKGIGGLDTLATPGSFGAGEPPHPIGGPIPSHYDGPLDAPLAGKQMVVNLGPSHPAMHGVTRAVVALEGETIKSMKLDIGFLHPPFQKSCENVTWGQCFPYTDR